MRFYCPNCWHDFRDDPARCPDCGLEIHEFLKGKNFVDKLLMALTHPEQETAMRAVRILGNRRESRAVEPLRRLLAETQDPYLAGETVAALGKIDTPEARTALSAHVDHPAQMVRWEVRETLGRMGIDVPTGSSEKTAEGDRQEALPEAPRAPRPAVPPPLPTLQVYKDWPFDEAEAKRRRAETAMALRIPVEKRLHLRHGVTIRMVLIPAGEFDMGSPPGEAGRGLDETLHRVRITQPFYLGKHPVTQKQWRAVMGSNPSRYKGQRNPVEQVSWEDCQAFVQEVNEGAGANVLALPTEAQWEYACRAGTRSPCWFGNPATGLDKYAWYSAGFGDENHPVGATPPNAWGLHDMADYVGEWCADWYNETYYRRSPEEDPEGPEGGEYRVVRGASWYPIPKLGRSACRRWARPTYRSHDLGFRVAARVQLEETKGETDGKNDCVRPRTGNP